MVVGGVQSIRCRPDKKISERRGAHKGSQPTTTHILTTVFEYDKVIIRTILKTEISNTCMYQEHEAFVRPCVTSTNVILCHFCIGFLCSSLLLFFAPAAPGWVSKVHQHDYFVVLAAVVMHAVMKVVKFSNVERREEGGRRTK